MRIIVSSGDKQVDIKVKGKSSKKLAAAEATALRLLDATPESEPKTPIGFSTSSDTELAPEDE